MCQFVRHFSHRLFPGDFLRTKSYPNQLSTMIYKFYWNINRKGLSELKAEPYESKEIKDGFLYY